MGNDCTQSTEHKTVHVLCYKKYCQNKNNCIKKFVKLLLVTRESLEGIASLNLNFERYSLYNKN